MIHLPAFLALSGYRDLALLHAGYSPILARIQNPNPRAGSLHLFQFKLRIVHKQQRINPNVELLSDGSNAFALRLPRNLRAKKVFLQVELLKNLHRFIAVVLAGNGVQDSAVVQGLNDLSDLRLQLQFVRAIFDQNPVPHRMIQIPYHAFDLLGPLGCLLHLLNELHQAKIERSAVLHVIGDYIDGEGSSDVKDFSNLIHGHADSVKPWRDIDQLLKRYPHLFIESPHGEGKSNVVGLRVITLQQERRCSILTVGWPVRHSLLKTVPFARHCALYARRQRQLVQHRPNAVIPSFPSFRLFAGV